MSLIRSLRTHGCSNLMNSCFPCLFKYTAIWASSVEGNSSLLQYFCLDFSDLGFLKSSFSRKDFNLLIYLFIYLFCSWPLSLGSLPSSAEGWWKDSCSFFHHWHTCWSLASWVLAFLTTILNAQTVALYSSWITWLCFRFSYASSLCLSIVSTCNSESVFIHTDLLSPLFIYHILVWTINKFGESDPWKTAVLNPSFALFPHPKIMNSIISLGPRLLPAFTFLTSFVFVVILRSNKAPPFISFLIICARKLS